MITIKQHGKTKTVKREIEELVLAKIEKIERIKSKVKNTQLTSLESLILKMDFRLTQNNIGEEIKLVMLSKYFFLPQVEIIYLLSLIDLKLYLNSESEI